MSYRPRFADAPLAEFLDSMGGVLVSGPRGCGKSTTAMRVARSQVRLDSGPNMIELATLNPAALLEGPTPRLVDEWQLAPTLWNAVRHEIDARQGPGQFILSGSSTPREDMTRHSGAGRIARLRMRTMSLSESGNSTNQITLEQLSSGDSVSGKSNMSYMDLAEAAVVGGWPALLDSNVTSAVTFGRSYLDDLCDTEIPLATGVSHDPVRLRRLIESVARNTATEVTVEKLAQDVSADGGVLNPKTARTYLDALATVFALDELPAWSVALRSKSRLHTRPKISLADPSLACAALGIQVDRLARDPEFFGQIFESLVTRDLRAMIEAKFGRAYHYRDNTGLEVDLILEFPNGTWGALEVKLGEARVPEAEKSLLTLKDSRIDLHKVGSPAFLAVVTGTEFAFTRASGVHVVPLATLTA